MDDHTLFTFIWITAIILAVIVSFFFFFYVKALTTELIKKLENSKLECRHYWRFLCPWVALTILGFISMDVRMTKWGHLVWIILVSVLVPWGFTWIAHRDILARRWDRVFLILTLILGFNFLTLTGGWAFERRWQIQNYQGAATITAAYPLVDNNGEYLNQVRMELTWSCPQYSYGSCTDSLMVDCDGDSADNSDYDMTIYPVGNNNFQSCYKGFSQLQGDDDGFVSPYMMISGDCYYCEIDDHSKGNLYRGVKRMIVALGILTALSTACWYFFRSTMRKETSIVSPDSLIGAPKV